MPPSHLTDKFFGSHIIHDHPFTGSGWHDATGHRHGSGTHTSCYLHSHPPAKSRLPSSPSATSPVLNYKTQYDTTFEHWCVPDSEDHDALTPLTTRKDVLLDGLQLWSVVTDTNNNDQAIQVLSPKNGLYSPQNGDLEDDSDFLDDGMPHCQTSSMWINVIIIKTIWIAKCKRILRDIEGLLQPGASLVNLYYSQTSQAKQQHDWSSTAWLLKNTPFSWRCWMTWKPLLGEPSLADHVIWSDSLKISTGQLTSTTFSNFLLPCRMTFTRRLSFPSLQDLRTFLTHCLSHSDEGIIVSSWK